MKKDDPNFMKAHDFAFKEVFNMLRTDLDRIFMIGTAQDRNQIKGGLNLSSCAVVLLGIEAMSKFETIENDDAKSVEKFVDKYFPDNYNGKFKNIFLSFRHGLLHHFYPKSISAIAKITFLVDENEYVRDLAYIEKTGVSLLLQKFEKEKDGTIHVIPQVLYIDFLKAVKKFEEVLFLDHADQHRAVFYENYARIKKILGHKP